MIIVRGYLIVDADQRTEYLHGCTAVVEQAREVPGCIDFALSADLVDAERVNVFECWETRAALEAFRGDGPDQAQQDLIRFVDIHEHEVA